MMSDQRPHKRIKIGRNYYLELRKRCLLLALPAALLSALSVGMFCFVRASAEMELYYSGEKTTLLADSLSSRTLIMAAVFWLLYAVIFHGIRRCHVTSALVSLLLAFNINVALSMEHSGLREIFLPLGTAGNIAVLLGFAVMIFACVELFYLWADHKTRYRIWAEELDGLEDGEIFFGAWACILILWLPILFCCYPGSVMNDTRYQIMGWLGLEQITASHPILTTVFYGALYQLGLAIGGQEKAIFLCLLCQDLIVSAAMGLAVMVIYRYTRSRAGFWLAVAFFGLLPVWQSAAQVLLKDVLHTGCFLLFTCVYFRCLREKKKSWRNVLLLFLAAVLVAYTRKATFYLAVVCLLAAALWHWRTFLLPYLAMLGVFIGLFWFSNNVLYPYLGITEEWESENYSMQFQQVALYCRTYREEMTEEEIEIVNSALDFDAIVENYTPMISDPVKSTYHDSWRDQSAFWDLYREMFRRHPMLFVRAIVMDTFEHFNPWYDGISFRVYISHEEDFITVDYKSDLHQTVNDYWNACLKIPVVRVLIGTGLYAWIILIVLAYSIHKKSKLALVGLLPSIALMIGLLMSHVNGEIRYGYPLIAAAPLDLAWVLFAVSSKSPENPIRSTSRLKQKEPFRLNLLKRIPEEEVPAGDFDPDAPLPELPPDEAPVHAGDWKKSPMLRFVTRYIPVPRAPRTYLDFLKVLAIFLVLWNHTSNGFELYNRVLEMPRHLLYLCVSIVDKIAVPLFFMASGALLLGREESWRKILTHRVRRFALILIAVSAISYVYYFRGDRGYSVSDFARRLFTGDILMPLWYLYSYLAFLLMLPFLRKLARCMRERDYIWLVCLYIVSQLLPAADFFLFHGQHYHSSDFVLFTSQNYVVYALCGFYLERVMKKERLNLETLTVLTMLSVVAVGATYMLTQWRMAWFGTWLSSSSQAFLNTFIVIPSVTVFYAAKFISVRRPVSARAAAVWSLLGTGTFGTYLFERFWRDTAWPVYEFCTRKLSPFLSSFVHVAVACALGILATLAFKIVTGTIREKFREIFKLPSGARKKDKTLVYTAPSGDISDLVEIEEILGGTKNNRQSPD